MSKTEKSISTNVVFPELSHPNYRVLDWGPDFTLNRRKRRKTFSRWEDLDESSSHLIPPIRILSKEEALKLEEYYRTRNMINIFYCSNPLWKVDCKLQHLDAKLSNVTGRPQVCVNDPEYLQLIRSHLEGSLLNDKPKCPNLIGNYSKPFKHGKPFPFLPCPFIYTGTIANQRKTLDSKLAERTKSISFRITDINRNPRKKWSNLESIKRKFSKQDNKLMKNAMQNLYMDMKHSTNEPAEAILKRLYPEESRQIPLMYDLAQMAFDQPRPTNSKYRIRIPKLLAKSHRFHKKEDDDGQAHTTSTNSKSKELQSSSVSESLQQNDSAISNSL